MKTFRYFVTLSLKTTFSLNFNLKSFTVNILLSVVSIFSRHFIINHKCNGLFLFRNMTSNLTLQMEFFFYHSLGHQESNGMLQALQKQINKQTKNKPLKSFCVKPFTCQCFLLQELRFLARTYCSLNSCCLMR